MLVYYTAKQSSLIHHFDDKRLFLHSFNKEMLLKFALDFSFKEKVDNLLFETGKLQLLQEINFFERAFTTSKKVIFLESRIRESHICDGLKN